MGLFRVCLPPYPAAFSRPQKAGFRGFTSVPVFTQETRMTPAKMQNDWSKDEKGRHSHGTPTGLFAGSFEIFMANETGHATASPPRSGMRPVRDSEADSRNPKWFVLMTIDAAKTLEVFGRKWMSLAVLAKFVFRTGATVPAILSGCLSLSSAVPPVPIPLTRSRMDLL